jgi:uncharacterized protein YbjQ (UPF0145 family)
MTQSFSLKGPVARSHRRMTGLASIGWASLVLLGCGYEATTPIDAPPKIVQAGRIQIFIGGAATGRPVKTVLGQVQAHTCQYPYDRSAAETDALSRLGERAVKLGANGLVNVQLYTINNGPKNPCWRSVGAAGTAVSFDRATN